MTNPLSRDIPVDPSQTALLFIDVQNFGAHREGGEYKDTPPEKFEAKYGWFFEQFETVALPNMQRLQSACRDAGVEVMYTVIESLTLDGRDRSLDYKITGFNVPRGSWDARVVDGIAPVGDEIVIPKTSSSVFISTNIDYVLRNLGVKQIIMSGMLTDQCVDLGGARRLRHGLSRNHGDRRLRDPVSGTARRVTAPEQGILPPGHHGAVDGRVAGVVGQARTLTCQRCIPRRDPIAAKSPIAIVTRRRTCLNRRRPNG